MASRRISDATGWDWLLTAGRVTGRSPISSAVAIALLENSRTNSFAFWRNSAVRTAELIGLRPVRLPTVGSPSQPVASEIRREAN